MVPWVTSLTLFSDSVKKERNSIAEEKKSLETKFHSLKSKIAQLEYQKKNAEKSITEKQTQMQSDLTKIESVSYSVLFIDAFLFLLSFVLGASRLIA